MTLRAAAAKLESLSKAHTANSDMVVLSAALVDLANGLFHEFAHLHDRLDKLDAALKRIEPRPDPAPANGQ